ncbi:MAG: MBL fold metallo-hydrolase [Gemmataceae bacterium]|nr:MBL fold metallo-hydrolase [Gemmataceae bacterium]
MTDPPRVTFLGAVRTVTGSMHRLDARGKTLLLDCGLFQGSRRESHQRNRNFPFRPRDIDGVLLSHAHIDHCGNLPNLVRQGFSGPIWCTPPTRALAAVMLGDAAKIQEEDAEYLNRKRKPGEPKIEPLYDGRDVYQTLIKLQALPYDKAVEVVPGIEATFVEAGHLLGSAMIHLRIDQRGRESRLTFTGDIGRPGTPLLRDAAPIPPADLILCESTYGGHTHEVVSETVERLGEVVRKTVERGGKVIIPAFAVGRTQVIVYFLRQLKSSGRIPDVPVFVDSPMSVRATEVFHAHVQALDEETQEFLRRHPDLFAPPTVTYIESVHESIQLNDRAEPCVIISASGMCEAGRILHHLKHHIEDKRNTVLIAGYQAEGTLGRRLVERYQEVRILGQTRQVRAEIVVLNGLSAHVDHPELLAMLQPLVERNPKIRLVHGESPRGEALAEGLRSVGFTDVAVPQVGDETAF